MNKKVVIFDFDGTIADSFLEVVEIFNKMAQEYKFHEVDSKSIPELRKLSSMEILEKFEFPKWRLPFLLKKGKRMLNERIKEVSVFGGMREALKELDFRGYTTGILSSNSEENIKKFLEYNGIDTFNFIFTESNLFGKAKVIRKIIKKYNFILEEVAYVGDETRDIEAAQKCGVASIAVTWGFNEREILEKYNPDYLIDEPNQLLNILKI